MENLNKILLVDDEQDIRDVLAVSLTDKGYDVFQAENGDRALRIFKKETPAIVLTDIKMPGMDGIELLQKIKQENHDTEVIMITGHGDTDLAIKSLKYEAIDFITKPINDDSLEIALKRAVEKIDTREKLREYTRHLERLLQEKTELQDRLSSLGLMVGSVSHGIKGMLTKLDAGIYLVETALNQNKPKQTLEGLDMLKVTVSRLQKTVLDILYYSKERKPNLSKIDAAAFYKELESSTASKVKGKPIRLVFDFQNAPKTFTADENTLRSALINVLENAVDACTMDKSKSEHEIRLAAKQDEKRQVIEIIDDGPGMDETTLNHLFNLFYSSKGDRGTGFGLFLTKNIIEQHQGVIHAHSVPGRGSRFIVKIPLHIPETEMEKTSKKGVTS